MIRMFTQVSGEPGPGHQEDLELVRKTFDAVHSGRPEAFLRVFPTDCIWFPFQEWPGGPRSVTGHEGVRSFMAEWTETFDEYSAVLYEIRDVGDRVVGLAEQTAKIKRSGVPVRHPFGFVCSDIRDGTIGEVRFFLTWRQTLEAVGLSE